MRRAALYVRVSTLNGQTTENQERALREVADRMGCEIVHVYRDQGISGAKGRNGRPAFDALCKGAARREFDIVMAWSVDRLGRSLQDLVAFLTELHALKIDLYLHQQGGRRIPVAWRSVVGHVEPTRSAALDAAGRHCRIRARVDPRAHGGGPQARHGERREIRSQTQALRLSTGGGSQAARCRRNAGRDCPLIHGRYQHDLALAR